MRPACLLALAILLAGCGGPKPPATDDPDGDGLALPRLDAPPSFDRLTDRLAPESAAFQDFAHVEDAVDLPGNGSIELQSGLGLMCYGDADGVAPNATGWVACMLRLAGDHDAMAQDVHELGIGPDAQRLSLRQPAEPVEWRVLVTLADGATAYDSGWRAVDLSPRLEDPIVTLEMHDPCDRLDAREQGPIGAQAGLAVLVVEGLAAHGRPVVEVDLGPESMPMAAESTPFADHATFEHGFAAMFPTAAEARAFRLELPVDLELAETLDPGASATGPCTVPLRAETQEWTILVGIVGADGTVESKPRSVRVDAVLDGRP